MSLPQWFPRPAVAAAALAILGAFIVAGCSSDDSNPADGDGNGGPTFTATRTTARELLEMWFNQAYNQENGERYAEMLHDDFEFVFEAEDADSFGMNTLTKAQDVASTNGMFTNANVTLGFQSITETESPDCAGCRLLSTSVILTVTDPPETLGVTGEQDIVAAPDPDEPGLWVVYRQVDQKPTGKQPSSVDQVSWGQIKYRYLQ